MRWISSSWVGGTRAFAYSSMLALSASYSTSAGAFGQAYPPASSSQVMFRDIAPDPGSGLAAYRNVGALREAELQDLVGIPISFEVFLGRPYKPNGSPGVAVFDYDNDGDLDLYVANGPGRANSLFSNQLEETGSVWFIDRAEEAGVTASSQETSGVIAGDIDNDGDQDLLALGIVDENLLFENQGDGTFLDITDHAGVAGTINSGSATATMGDVDGDGLLDLFIGNGLDVNDYGSIFVFNPEPVSHNQLFRNLGDNQFEDVTQDAGLLNTRGQKDAAGNNLEGLPGITWSVSMADYDLDGDVDIFTLDDQGALPSVDFGGVNFGLIHLFENDGTGHFVDVNVERGLAKTGAWMGIAFGDFDANGSLDFFGSNFGDTNVSQALQAPLLGVLTSRWFFGQPDKSFVDPLTPSGLPGVTDTPFGWGNAAFDYDNDGDTDILFHGDMDDGLEFTVSNPAALLRNDGAGHFAADEIAFSDSTDHLHRMVTGVAVGDLDRNGFVDVVSVSAVNVPPEKVSPNPWDFGGPYDDGDGFVFSFEPLGDPFDGGMLLLNEDILDFPDGTLAVDLNEGNSNRSTAVQLLGTVELTSEGRVNRDGVGAMLTFVPEGGSPVMRPVTAGSTYSSTHSRIAHFGMGHARHGQLDVLWPGSLKNRVYGVRSGEVFKMPEIPCSIVTPEPLGSYVHCLSRSLLELRQGGHITSHQKSRLFVSALLAYFEERDAG